MKGVRGVFLGYLMIIVLGIAYVVAMGPTGR